MSSFLVLFWKKQGEWKPPSPQEMERLTKAWMSWMDGLKQGGHLIKPGERLDGTGKVVRGGGKAVTDGPYAEAKDMIVGYLLMHAKDLAHAVELVRGCPNLEDGGLVEVRPILSM